MWPLHWFLITPCGLCGEPLGEPREERQHLCQSCRSRYGLPSGGLAGGDPIAWWGAGPYAGELRELLLRLRRRPRAASVQALAGVMARSLKAACSDGERPLLVAIPSWKRNPNPLPGLLCQALERQGGLRRAELLERSRPVLGQHHLRRSLRLANQDGAFRCRRPPAADERARRPLLIVDDILTSGATVCSAAATLRQAGWRVRGAICLARTPWERGQTVI